MSAQQLNAILEMSIQNPPPPLVPPAQFRAWIEAGASQLPSAEGVHFQPVQIGTMQGELLVPTDGDPSRLIVFYHGGAFFFGSPRSHRVITSQLARLTGASVLVPDYRLAPEYPAPAAHDDALAAYAWALEQGYRARRVALVGDSAGGNLALSTALAARDQGVAAPAAVFLMSPWLDFAGDVGSQHSVSDDPIVPLEMLTFAKAAYFGAPGSPLQRTVATLSSDLSNLPPLLVHAGSWERLRDDSVNLVERIRDAGGHADLVLFEGMVHVWQLYAPILDEGMTSLQSGAAFLRTRLA